ncbi:MAG TPA: sulfatase [Acidimicrobiales bacterium]|nr:sulfatase [Acidimicrobiales bacterium]
MAHAAAGTGPVAPPHVVVVLLDSLNRHMLGCYGGAEFATPNLDRFAARATRFTNHVTGSLPCMPARHDILCGALDFLWKPWGSIELWERPVTADLEAAGVTTMLVSDHPHLFETGGENYHTDFGGWDYVRGHEGDPWRTHVDTSWVGTPAPPARDGGWFYRKLWGDGLRIDRAYDRTRTFFRAEEDYPGPRTMATAADWLRRAAPQHDRWLLFVDEFDPHEPFDTPAPWLGRYEDEPWDGDLVIWPPYVVGGVSRGWMTGAEGRHVRANYGSKLSMIDHWFGEVLAALDEGGLWDSTAVVVCTDHGHYLGDVRGGDDIWGKPGAPQYEPLGHLPLLVHWPGVAGGGTCDALTTSVDLHATLADVFGVTPRQRTHGRSLRPLLSGSTGSTGPVREWAIGGVWGNWVQVTDGRRKYARAPVEGNRPLAMWSNRWSTMPLHMAGMTELPAPDHRAALDYMPGSTVPVIRQPFGPDDRLPFWAGSRPVPDHLYDLDVDPDEAENRAGEPRAEREMAELLRTALDEVEAPAEQYARLGLA